MRPRSGLLALITAVGLLAGGSLSVQPVAAQEGEAGGIVVGDTSGPVTPLDGWPAQEPTGTESAPPASTNDGEVGAPLGAESVIGADGRSRVNPTTTSIARRIGQLEINQTGFGNFICSAWLIDDNSLLTAGHCGFDHVNGGFPEAVTWYPGRNGATDPYGGCAVTAIYVPPTEWQLNAQPYWDYSVMNFADPGPCAAIGDTLGTFGVMAYSGLNALNGQQATVQGYPGDKPAGTQWKMNGHIAKANKQMVFYPMDTFGGQSGSPVFWNRTSGPCTGACGYAVHAYGVGLPAAGQNNNAGPRLTSWRIGQIGDWADDNGG